MNDHIERCEFVSFILFCTMVAAAALITGCSLTKKGPDRAPSERYYKFSEEKGKVYHRRCDKLKRKKRKCEIIQMDILEKWDFFKYGDFIVIPYKYL